MSGEQLPLDIALPRRRAFGRDAFLVSGSNEAALAMVEGWRLWPGGQAALTGPEGAGKTHLAHVWMELSGAEKIAADKLSPEDAPALVAAGAAVVEDADRAAGVDTALFHLMNLARAEGAALLLTGRAPPARWPVGLPDLRSRLAALTHVALDPPDGALMEGLIAKQFADRHLRVGAGVARFLALRVERSAAAARETVARLDRRALETGRAITVPFAKETLGL